MSPSSIKSIQRPFRTISLSLVSCTESGKNWRWKSEQQWNFGTFIFGSLPEMSWSKFMPDIAPLIHEAQIGHIKEWYHGPGGWPKDFPPWKRWEQGCSQWGICLLNGTETLMWGHSGHQRSLGFFILLLTVRLGGAMGWDDARGLFR